jgi:hypothetical protein
MSWFLIPFALEKEAKGGKRRQKETKRGKKVNYMQAEFAFQDLVGTKTPTKRSQDLPFSF